MLAMLRHVEDHGKRYDCLAFICPGCKADGQGTGLHMLPVNTDQTSPSWSFDGDLLAPTLQPSILTHHEQSDTDPRPTFRCHSFLTEGLFNFLDDSTHVLRGTTVPMLPLPDWFVHEDNSEDTEASGE